jgi:F-type H+-transporting ATPase subunit a
VNRAPSNMGLEFLSRVRRTTLWVSGVVLLVLATFAPLAQALGVALGALWSLANLALLERLVVAITSPERGTAPAVKNAAIAAALTLALFGAGGMLLTLLPPLALAAGFALPLAVLVLKAASALLLESRAWRWLVSNPWRAALAVAVVLVAAWWLVPTRVLSQAGHGAGAPAAAESSVAGAVPESAPAHEAPAEGGSAGPQKFANVITVLARAFPNAEWAHFLHHYEIPIFAMFIAILICVICYFATRNAQMIPGPLQNVVELLVGGLDDFIGGILGREHAPRYVPFLGSLFIYIWVMNLFGLIPFMDSPTSSLNTTFALAITVFVYVQWIGLRALGPVGYVHHLMGSPRDVTSWLLAPLMLPIHVLGELAKPISLSCRLFGNIFGEDMLLVAFVSLGITSLSFAHLPFGLPLQLPFMFLALLTGTLQALVFTVLSTIYILLMLPHDEHEHEGETQHAHSH